MVHHKGVKNICDSCGNAANLVIELLVCFLQIVSFCVQTIEQYVKMYISMYSVFGMFDCKLYNLEISETRLFHSQIFAPHPIEAIN